MVRGGLILFAGLLATALPASAQTARLGAAPNMSFADASALLAKSCGADLDANCRGVNFDSNRLRECLSRNSDVLSDACKNDYLRALDAIAKRIAARVSVANACGREIVRLCRGSTKETSKAVPCLVASHGVSRYCTQAMDEAGYR
jgi:hypothetical protein